MYEFMVESKTDRGVINEKLDQIIRHTKETNGRVHKLEVRTEHLEKEMLKADAMLEKAIHSKIGTLKVWTLKVVLVALFMGSFLWIKESRDAIIHILKLIV